MRYELAVIIINYKTGAMTEACVSSVLTEISGRNAHVVIVDNHSADGSEVRLRNWIGANALSERVTLIESTVNLGFSGGNNLGIRSVDADYYMLLNSDTLLRPHAVETLLGTFSGETRIGIASPRLEYEDGTGQISCFRFHSPVSEFIDITNTGLITRLLDRYNVPIAMQPTISFPDWTSFACVVMRRELIADIGLMDSHFFLYYEDSDYCRMAKDHGWLVANNPAAHVVHFRGGSAELKRKKQAKQRLPRYYFHSRSYYFRKHYGRLGLLGANLLWTLGRMISSTRELLERKPRAASEWQWLDIWKSPSHLNE